MRRFLFSRDALFHTQYPAMYISSKLFNQNVLTFIGFHGGEMCRAIKGSRDAMLSR